MKHEAPGFFDKESNFRLILRTFYVVCSVVLLLDVVVHRHVMHSWDQLWGFYAIFGFVACVALVLIAKEMRKVVMRSEDYYDD